MPEMTVAYLRKIRHNSTALRGNSTEYENPRTARWKEDDVRSIMLDDEFFTPAEAAGLFGVSPKTLARWADAGKVPVVFTMGGHRRYPQLDLVALRMFNTQQEQQ